MPSAASPVVEPIPVTMILPHSIFGGAMRSGVGDVRASPRVQHSHGDGSSSSIPVVAGFDWVRSDVLKYRLFLQASLLYNAK